MARLLDPKGCGKSWVEDKHGNLQEVSPPIVIDIRDAVYRNTANALVFAPKHICIELGLTAEEYDMGFRPIGWHVPANRQSIDRAKGFLSQLQNAQ